MASSGPTEKHKELLHDYGLFMVVWSVFETVIDFIIYRESKLELLQFVILMSGSGFERKASIARSFLSIQDPPAKEAMNLIDKITETAERNATVHGQVYFGRESLDFVKRDTRKSLKIKRRSFKDREFLSHIKTVNEMVGELQDALRISDDEIQSFGANLKNLESRFSTSPKPPSSTTDP